MVTKVREQIPFASKVSQAKDEKIETTNTREDIERERESKTATVKKQISAHVLLIIDKHN